MILTPIGIEVVTIFIPNICIVEVLRMVGLHVVDHRIATHDVLFVSHLNIIDSYDTLLICIVVTPLRFENIVVILEYATIVKVADVRFSVKRKVVCV